MIRRLVFAFVLLTFLSGCGKFLGNLRRDLDDSEPYHAGPTVGGTWTERGYLSNDQLDDRYSVVGHSERSPASGPYQGSGARDSWINSDQADANARDRYRRTEGDDGVVTYSDAASMPPAIKRAYKNGIRATREDFIDDSKNEGSLWGSDGQTNYYFTKNKIRGVGDIIAVQIQPELLKDTHTEITRTLSEREKLMELQLAQERLRAKALGIPDTIETSSAAPNRQPAAENQQASEEKKDVEVPKATLADIDVSKSVDLKENDTIMAEVTDRYPNGNYRIRGTKRVRYGNGFKFMSLVGVVRGSDITEDDTVPSGKLYEYRLEVIR